MKNAIKVVCFVLAVLVVSFSAGYIYFTWDVGEFEYINGSEKGTVIITNYIGSEKDVTIPKKLRGKKVVAVDDAAFRSTDITSVVIEKNVKSIGSNVFQGCTNLKSVDLGPSVESVGEMAFADCTALNYVKFSPVLKNIGSMLFRNNPNKLEIDLNGNKNFAYEGGILYSSDKTVLYETLFFADLSEYKLPESVTELKSMAFYGQEEMKSFTFNSSVKHIPDGCFSMCKGMTELVIPDSVESIGDLILVGSNISTVEVPRSVRKIGEFAFEHNEVTALDDEGNPLKDENGEEVKEYEHVLTIVTYEGSRAASVATEKGYKLTIKEN